jgi:glycosyltransferase involved in cell wall biosynthesis
VRILVVTDQWFPDLKGGVARVAAETAERLAARGHRVTVLAPRVNGSADVTTDGSLTVRRTLRRTRLPRTVSDVIATAGEARRLPERPDLAVAHCSTTAAGLLAAGVEAPLAYVYHSSAVRELRDVRTRLTSPVARLKTYPLTPPLALYERWALDAAARVVLLSDFSRSLVAADHPRSLPRVRRVPGGVDVDSFSPGQGQQAAREALGLVPTGPLLVSVRRLEPRMGLDRLLRAVSLLAERGPIELALIGGGSLEGELRRLAASLGLEERVRFAGRVPDEQLREWYRAADLFVLPTVAYEGFGMVTAEALATGTPVVGTPVGATPELLEALDPRLVSRGTEPGDLADAVAAALAVAGPGFRRRCREYAVERFSWDSAIPAWEAAFAEAAAAPRRGR